jgi:hypothetical protein
MMKPTQRNFVPPWDFSIMLPPGHGFTFDEESNKKYEAQIHQLELVRGKVLSSSFEVEWHVGKAIAKLFFSGLQEPSNQHGLGECQFIDYIVNEMTFFQKSRTLKNLVRAIESDEVLLSQRLFKRLHNVRSMRNYFAHCPIQLLPHQTADGTTFEVYIQSAKRQVHLDQALLDSFHTDASDAVRELRQLTEPSRVDDETSLQEGS